jgi:hypothetical protein
MKKLINDKTIEKSIRVCYWHSDYVMPRPFVLSSKFVRPDKHKSDELPTEIDDFDDSDFFLFRD